MQTSEGARTKLCALALSALATIAGGCGSTMDDANGLTTPTANIPNANSASAPVAASSDPHSLGGVDTTKMSEREQRTWWRFVSTLPAPCSDQAVSIAQCVDEKRACAGCAPAAALLAEKIREGATADQVQALYGERFGAVAKPFDPSGSPAVGPADAPVVLVEWFDFECPHCRLTQPLLADLEKKHPNDLRVVKKFYPLQAHQHAEGAARAAIAALNQGKYFEMEALLFAHQTALEDANLDQYAQQLGLDMNRFKADLHSEKTTALLKRDHDEAEKDGLQGTPFILINGREFDMTYFHLDTDLDPWVTTEAKLKKK